MNRFQLSMKPAMHELLLALSEVINKLGHRPVIDIDSRTIRIYAKDGQKLSIIFKLLEDGSLCAFCSGGEIGSSFRKRWRNIDLSDPNSVNEVTALVVSSGKKRREL